MDKFIRASFILFRYKKIKNQALKFCKFVFNKPK